MDFRILGPLEALDRGQPVPLGGTKRRAVLALLLLHANETLSTDRLVDELWGDQPPASAAKTVQVHISRLRRALVAAGETDLVLTREHGYELLLDPEHIDARRFERLVAEGRAGLSAGDPGGRPHRARRGAFPVARPAACRPRVRAVRTDRRPRGSRICA